MNKKAKSVICAIVSSIICVLILFFTSSILKESASKYKGMSTSTGYMVNGEYKQTNTGVIGGNSQKYNELMTLSERIENLAKVVAVICIIVDTLVIILPQKNNAELSTNLKSSNVSKYCSSCGNDLKESTAFCGKCGNKLM